MSYEGYTQRLCENGHLYETPHWAFGDELLCECGSTSVFENDVDDTNCDNVGIIPDFEWKKLLLKTEVRETCNLGHEHVLQEATYRIPTRKEHTQMVYSLIYENKGYDSETGQPIYEKVYTPLEVITN